MADIFASTSGPEGAECFRIPEWQNRPGYAWKRGIWVIIAWTDKLYPASYVILHVDCKKHLPGRIVPSRVAFPGCTCVNVHVRTVIEKIAAYVTSGGSYCNKWKNIFSPPTEYSLKNASFRLHPVWGTHPDDPAVTITEVLPLCPSQTNKNVGHKHRSQATQLGQNLIHIDAYNGEEKVHMRKGHICGELDARKIIISFCKRSLQVIRM